MKISFIGIGRLGGALALALSKKNYQINDLIVRNRGNAEKILPFLNVETQISDIDRISSLSSSDIIFLTVQDAEIETVIAKMSDKKIFAPFIFHTSGSLSSEVFNELKVFDCRVASFHPLVAVSDSVSGAEKFSDVYFCLEGDAEAVAVGQKIVADLQGKSFMIATEFKALYHASAVTSAGHLTALFSVAVEMLSACGLSAAEAQKILLPLAKSTIENLQNQTPAQALTGTFARGDAETLKKHLSAMQENVSAEIVEIYRQLGVRSLHLAEMQGLSKNKRDDLRKILGL